MPPPTPSPWRRPLSPIEAVWLTAADLRPPFAIALVIELDHPWDLPALRRAVDLAATSLPSTRATLRGLLCIRRWQDVGRAPAVHEIEAGTWDGRSDQHAPFLDRPLRPETSPFEVLLVRGTPERLVFRAHHAAADGRGVVAWARAVCAAGRGEPLAAPGPPITDLTVSRRATPVPPVADDAVSATGSHDGTPGVRWARRTVVGRWNGFTWRVAHALAGHARTVWPEGCVRVQVPVDLRPHGHQDEVGNLIGMVGTEVHPEDGWEAVRDRLQASIAAGEAAGQVRGVWWLVHVPRWLMRWAGAVGMRRSIATGRHAATAVVSNIGEVELDALSVPGARALTAYVVPPAADATSAFLVATRCGEETEIVLTMASGLASGGRLEGLLDAVERELTG
jgi:hypothetical protein